MGKAKINAERRMQIGEEKRARTRVEILKAAYELIGSPNGRDIRIENICKAVGISRATAYNYFTSIGVLCDELGYEISHDLNVDVRKLQSAMHAGAERTSIGIRYYLYRTREDPAWGWAVVNLSGPGPLFGVDTFGYVTNTIADGVAAGEFNIPSVTIGRDLTLGTVYASMISLLSADQSDDYAERVAQQILVGLGVKEDIIRRCIATPLPTKFSDMEIRSIVAPKIDRARLAGERKRDA